MRYQFAVSAVVFLLQVVVGNAWGQILPTTCWIIPLSEQGGFISGQIVNGRDYRSSLARRHSIVVIDN